MTLNLPALREIKNFYGTIKPDIESRLDEFRDKWKDCSDEELFAELVFCLLTPQSKARACWKAVTYMKKKGLLFKGSRQKIVAALTGVRFKNNKTRYILKARKDFLIIKKKIKSSAAPAEIRDWLAENILGLGLKESGHFLRNIGIGGQLAILDRHILKNLKRLGVISEIPASLPKREYYEIEKKMQAFAEKSGIPLAHLDLLLWARETGEIFK